MKVSEMKKIMAALFAGLFVILVLVPNPSEARSVNLPSPQCHPSIVSSMPPRIRKICEALSTIWQFSDAMDNYLDEQGDNFNRNCFLQLRNCHHVFPS
jgi:hypothetical protein